MTKDEALRLALEALELHGKQYPHMVKGYCLDAITAIKEALKTKDEPKCVAIVEVFEKDWRLDYMALPVGKHKLYAQQYTYTTPPQSTWVGLTDEEIWGTISRIGTSDSDVNPYAKLADARAIEAKLKENT